MLEKILLRMRQSVQEGNYTIVEHAHDSAMERDITGLEIEQAILGGTIVEHQRDAITDERKYIIRHQTSLTGGTEVVEKIGPTGRLYIITVYQI